MYKLLIVDDEPWSRRLIREVLDWPSLGFKEIHEAQDGQEALDAIARYHHDLMITDMRMPGIDGVELLNRMTIHPKTKVIVMSGYDDFSYLRQALQVKAIDYLLKPIIKSEIDRAVRQAISTMRQESVETHLMGLASDLRSNPSFIKYLNLKNQLYGAIIEKDEAQAFRYVDAINLLIRGNEKHPEFRVYVHQDMGYMIEELVDDHLTKAQAKTLISTKDAIEPMKDIIERIESLIKCMRQSDTQGKLDIEKVVAYVDAHYTKNITLDSLSGVFFISKEHLSRAFKKETKETVVNYINNKRILYAQQLMAVRGFSPKTAAAMAGFAHLHYFYRVFKAKTGQTPHQYASKENINIV